MKNTIFANAAIASGLILFGAGCGTSTPTPTPTPNPTPVVSDSPKNATYTVDNAKVTLVDGKSIVALGDGATEKQITTYFGNEAVGDLNGDGKDDTAFILTQSSGGTGMFYYVVAALKTANGYDGTNAVLLGDRIAPQSTVFQNGKITVNYADRGPNDSFAVQPSVGVSKTVRFMNGKLTDVTNIARITDQKWTWLGTKMNDGKTISPKKAQAFTLTMKEDGTLSGTTDCNGYFGSYTTDGNKIAFDKIGSALMFCEGAQEGIYMKYLADIESFLITKDGKLALQIKMDSGTMTFSSQP
jgi:heat shock protein HslJ